MKSLSIWASKNILAARVLITLIISILMFLALLLGLELFIQDVRTTKSATWLILLLNLPIILLYKKVGKVRTKRIIIHLAFILINILGISTQISNRALNLVETRTSDQLYASLIMQPDRSSKADDVSNKTSFRQAKKKLKKELKRMKKEARQNDDKKKLRGLKFALIVLGVIGLGYLLGALACSLSCSGHIAAANVLAIGGVVFLLGVIVFAAIKLWGKKNKKTD